MEGGRRQSDLWPHQTLTFTDCGLGPLIQVWLNITRCGCIVYLCGVYGGNLPYHWWWRQLLCSAAIWSHLRVCALRPRWSASSPRCPETSPQGESEVDGDGSIFPQGYFSACLGETGTEPVMFQSADDLLDVLSQRGWHEGSCVTNSNHVTSLSEESWDFLLSNLVMADKMLSWCFERDMWAPVIPAHSHRPAPSPEACWRFPGFPAWLRGGGQYIRPPPNEHTHTNQVHIKKTSKSSHLFFGRHLQHDRHMRRSGPGSEPPQRDGWL